MFPIRLTLEGIYSYRERQTVDFERLTGARLFGIFGAVGSGKSAILEAMVYAVYGTMDRVSTEEGYNVMNLQSDRLFVDFEFRAGRDGGRYRAVVENRRNRKQFEKVASPKFSYYEWDGEDWRPCERRTVTDAIGLSAQNFKRVVIIPQGKFQEFLMLKDKERTEMMMDLFGELRQYALYDRAAALEGEAVVREGELRGRLAGLGEVSDETVAERREELARVRGEVERLQAEMRAGREREEEMRREKGLLEEREERRRERKRLEERREEVERTRREVEEYEFCSGRFGSALGREAETGRRLERAEREAEAALRALEEKRRERDAFAERFAAVEWEYEGRDAARARTEGLERLLRTREVESALRVARGRREKGEEWVEKTRAEAEELRRRLERGRAEAERLGREAPDVKALYGAREWHVRQAHLSEARAEAVRELEAVGPAARPAEGKRGRSVAEVERLLAKAREELMALNTRKRLADFARELREGEACPLCGALSHPHPLRAGEADEELRAKETEIAGLEAEKRVAREEEAKAAVAAERERLRSAREKEAREKLAARERELAAHRGLFVWEGFSPDDAEAVGREIARAESMEKMRARVEEEVRGTERELERKQAELEKYRRAVEKIDEEIAQAEARRQALAEQQGNFDGSRYEGRDDGAVREEIERERRRMERAEREYREGSVRQKELEAEFRRREGSAEEKERELERARAERKEAERVLEGLLEGTGYAGAGEVRAVLERGTDVAARRREIDEHGRQWHAVEVRLAELEAAVAGTRYDAEEHAALARRMEATGALEREALERRGALSNLVADLEKKREERGRIGKELVAVEARLRNLRVLKSLFRGNDFVKFVSSIYLQNLCNAANERFYRMTRQRLKLELNEENDFVVRDFMNEGRMRSARTLSGGQVFQASLALALALTDNIRDLTGSDQNFFFLDEGFGSLDKESLRIVFDTLKSLREEERVVGLISHVEEMRQELPVCLLVENTLEHGSRIEYGT